MAKLTLQLSPEMDAVLDRLALERDVPKTQVLRTAVMLMDYLDSQVGEDKDILVRDNADGSAERLVLESQLSLRKGRDRARGRDTDTRDSGARDTGTRDTGRPGTQPQPRPEPDAGVDA